MYKDRNIELPKTEGFYNVYGTIKTKNGHSISGKFTAFYDRQTKCFCDKDGEDLIGIDKAVEWWFDISEVNPPI